MPHQIRLVRFTAIATLLCCLGCSGTKKLAPPKTVQVTGSVLQADKPVAGARVKFHPQFDIGDVKFIPYGDTGPDGKFEVNTGASGNGAPAGEYVVTVEVLRTGTDPIDGLEAEIDQLKGAYNDPAKSEWKITLNDGENVLEPFKLK